MGRSLAAAALAAVSLAVTLPVLAQPPGPLPPSSGLALREQADALRLQVRHALDEGRIDNDEAGRVLRGLRDLRNEEDAVRAQNGDRLPEPDRARLQARLDQLTHDIHWLPEAGAAPTPPPVNVWSLERREHWLEQQVSRGLAEESITPEEAARVRTEVTDIRYQEQRYRAGLNGLLSKHDRIRLEQRLDRLIQDIHWLRPPSEPRPW